jgi:hypothetical protein
MDQAALVAAIGQSDSDPDDTAPVEPPHPEEEDFLEPPPEIGDLVTLISKEGTRFHLSKDVAMVSGLLRSLFDPDVEFSETISREVRLPNIHSVVLEKVIDYMHFNRIWRSHLERMPLFAVDNSIAVETFVAADFLQL